jgi:hypothetical protein
MGEAPRHELGDGSGGEGSAGLGAWVLDGVVYVGMGLRTGRALLLGSLCVCVGCLWIFFNHCLSTFLLGWRELELS